MNLFALSSVLGALVGGITLGVLLTKYGALAIVFGSTAGLIVGWFTGPLLVFGVFVVGIAVTDGPGAALRFVRRRPR